MSYARFARRVDEVQPEIVDGLRSYGYHVEIIGRPVDLMVRKDWWPVNCWALLEVKSPGKRPRKDQLRQQEFCMQHRVPQVRTLDEAVACLRDVTWK